MSFQRTLLLIKPDAVAKKQIGAIYSHLEQADFQILTARRMHLTRTQAEVLYAVHKDRPFFERLLAFITSGPVMVQVLEGEAVIPRLRTLMGATDPAQADPGTLRAMFGSSVEENAVHGSDSFETACQEIALFFHVSEFSVGTVAHTRPIA